MPLTIKKTVGLQIQDLQTATPMIQRILTMNRTVNPKDITEKDIEEDLKNNDRSEGFETDIDTHGSDAQSETFDTIEPDKDNPVHKEFEIGKLSNEDLKEDERTKG